MEFEAILAPIRAALEVAPDNQALRRHLIGLLLEAGKGEEALTHCAHLLQVHPADAALLGHAHKAAELAGFHERAKGYGQLLAALGGIAGSTERAAADDDGAEDDGGGDKAPPTPAGLSGKPPEKNGKAAGSTKTLTPLRVISGGLDEEGEDSRNLAEDSEFERPTVTLSDVAGMEAVKRRLAMTFLEPLRNPKFREAYAKSLRGGLLLYGPPGCGKTFIARALAGELGARFYNIGLTDVLDMWLGNSERNLQALFENARAHKPCVLFLDELDGIGRRRSQLRNSGMSSVVTSLLVELDGVEKDNDGLFVLAATNHPWDVDGALRRPGRFDRTILVLPPDAPARDSILRYHLRERVNEGIDFAGIVKKTEHFSGADLAHLCETAAEHAMSEAFEKGEVVPIAMRHFQAAMKEVKGSTRAWFETARNYALYANEDGMFDDLLAYMKKL